MRGSIKKGYLFNFCIHPYNVGVNFYFLKLVGNEYNPALLYTKGVEGYVCYGGVRYNKSQVDIHSF